MAISTEVLRVEPRSVELSEGSGLQISEAVEAQFRSQWIKAEASKMIEDRRVAERMWKTVGYSSGAKIMSEALGSPVFDRIDASRNVSNLARSLAQNEQTHLILVSPGLLARASLNIPRDEFPIFVLDQKGRYNEARERLLTDVKVVIATPALATRWGQGIDLGPLPGVTQLHCAVPIFHPDYVRGWQKALPDHDRTTFHPAQGTWEEPLAHRVSQQVELMLKGLSTRHVFEHPTINDLPRIPMAIGDEVKVVEVGIARRLVNDLERNPAAAGRFQPVIAAAMALQKSGIDCLGSRADAAITLMAELEPQFERLLSGSRNLALAL